MSKTSNRNNFKTLERTQIASGVSIPTSQISNIPEGVENVISFYPSATAPSWGGNFVIDIKDTNMLIHNLSLMFNVSSISGTTGATNLRYNPAYFWINHIDLKLSGKVIDTYYPVEQFIAQQLLYDDEDRIYSNNAAGHYASVAQRTTLASGTSNYIVKLFSIFDQCNLSIVNQNQTIQLVVYMEPLANCVVNNGTGTPASTINSCQAIIKNTKLPVNVSEKISRSLNLGARTIFHKLLYMQYTAQAGVSSFNAILNTFVGKLTTLIFVVRPSASVTGDNAFGFVPVSSFNILDSTNNSLVGGNVIQSSVALQYLNLYYFNSSYTIETATGSIDNVGTVIDNKANVYAWSFSNNTVDALLNGQLNSSKQFVGTEQLQIQFTSALAASHNIDIFAFAESMCSQLPSGYDVNQL